MACSSDPTGGTSKLSRTSLSVSSLLDFLSSGFSSEETLFSSSCCLFFSVPTGAGFHLLY